MHLYPNILMCLKGMVTKVCKSKKKKFEHVMYMKQKRNSYYYLQNCRHKGRGREKQVVHVHNTHTKSSANLHHLSVLALALLLFSLLQENFLSWYHHHIITTIVAMCMMPSLHISVTTRNTSPILILFLYGNVVLAVTDLVLTDLFPTSSSDAGSNNVFNPGFLFLRRVRSG